MIAETSEDPNVKFQLFASDFIKNWNMTDFSKIPRYED
jgi:hypothetical protein